MGFSGNTATCREGLYCNLYFEPKNSGIDQEMNEKWLLYQGVGVYQGLEDHCKDVRKISK